MKYIYKITNIVNNKVYIGQSLNPQDRFISHMGKHSSSKSISNDVDIYGKGSFKLDIIEYVDNFQERERYWINYYREKGYDLYNSTKGGEEPPTFYGEENGTCIYSDEIRDKTIELLLNTNYTYTKISKIVNSTTDFVRRVNSGMRRVDGLDYPLRKEAHFDKIAKLIIYDLQNTKITQKEIAKKYGVARSMVTMINIGDNRYDEKYDYPLRLPVWHTPPEICKAIINDLQLGELNKSEISRKHKVAYEVVKRLNKKI